MKIRNSYSPNFGLKIRNTKGYRALLQKMDRDGGNIETKKEWLKNSVDDTFELTINHIDKNKNPKTQYSIKNTITGTVIEKKLNSDMTQRIMVDIARTAQDFEEKCKNMYQKIDCSAKY